MARLEKDAAELLLRALTDRHSAVTEKGFAVDLRRDTAAWRRAVSALGRHRAYRLMAGRLCALYESRFGRPFLFSERCVAFEIAYHAEAYFWTQGLGGRRHVSTLLYPRGALVWHCEVVDISTDDTAVWKQRTMFGYAAGVRPCWRGTEHDPFVRRGMIRRLAKRGEKEKKP